MTYYLAIDIGASSGRHILSKVLSYVIPPFSIISDISLITFSNWYFFSRYSTNTPHASSTSSTMSSSDFSKFSLTNEFINQNILDNTLVEVDIDNYLKLIKSKGNHIVFIGRETCSWCQKFKPNMKSAAKDYNITLYYIDTDKFIGEDWNKFKESEKYLTENEWGTPLTLLYKDGKLIDVLNGYVEETGIYEFLLKNGVIK